MWKGWPITMKSTVALSLVFLFICIVYSPPFLTETQGRSQSRRPFKSAGMGCPIDSALGFGLEKSESRAETRHEH